jgi:outer membrane protein OmpA-like peptidoglycan-associated protein
MKRLLPLVFCILILPSASAQKREITIKEYFTDAEFFFYQEEYIDALSDYLEVYKKGYDNNANINYKIGICYLNIPGQKGKSIQYLEKATSNASPKYRESTLNEVYAPIDVYLYLGNAYRVNYELDTAVARYRKYLELIKDKTIVEQEYVNKQIEGCYIAKEYTLNPRKVLFTNMGKLINTNNSNYNAVLSGDGSTLVYMSKLPFYHGVFMSRKRGENWSRPINITPQIMSDGDQVVTGISNDGNTILLTKSDVFDSDIYISSIKDGKWTKSKPIGKTINTKFWESHASFSADGKTIYFTSNRKGGEGAMDIYKSELGNKGEWGPAINLGNQVNTHLNEDTPFMSADGTKLFFSSQGHRNIGGYDFFFAELNDSVWGDPQNLQYPVSTTDEDLFFFPIKNGETALIHKILDDGYGVFDIYEVSFPSEEEIEEAITEQIEVDVTEEELIEDEETQAPVVIEIEPVLFAFDKSVLNKEALKQTSLILQLLLDNPDANLKIIGYTDALGPETYNLALSKRRAKEVASYFIREGVNEKRIITEGKGESEFVAANKLPDGRDNPEGRKFNRRVEFEISGLNSEWYIIKKVNIIPEALQINKK